MSAIYVAARFFNSGAVYPCYPIFSTPAGMICPITTEQITKNPTGDHDDLMVEWQHVFLIASSIHFFGVIFYAIFASGELQDWAVASPSEEKMEMNLDLEKPNNGVGANPNFDTGADEQTSMIDQADYGATANQSANPFTTGQASNPFRQ